MVEVQASIGWQLEIKEAYMAIDRSVSINGAVMSHHEVERVTHIVNTAAVVDVLSWKDSSKQDEPHRTILNWAIDDSQTFAEAEKWVASLPEFTEYIDPNKEALDELLPILTDEQAEIVTNIYPNWAVDISYTVGVRIQYDGKLYRCIQSHTSQEGWEPATTSALWTRTAKEDEILDWVQPTGAQDAYNKNDKVKHNGSTWISNVDANVWEPGVYGWDEFTE